ncbi:alanine--tRNA ligase [Candidatus Woesearchaeota archaeon]|nr:alanine--tRNA ligase [Candidatus Woesearchaeota archaeon]
MDDNKKVKADFKQQASKQPDKYYATAVLKEEGFQRKRCQCGMFFWTTTNQAVCGDPSCSGGFRFFDGTPAKNKMDYIECWQEFSKLFRKLGYTPIDRYPVAARWRTDTDFVQASIYDFQPYVVSGEVKPPANPLVVPQFCLRFNDIDNVGITGAHYTGFVMIGQHAFMPPEQWDQGKYFRDIHTWLAKGLGLPNHEITYHEDAWAGGGNFGPCMEFFSRGLELGNQVYMMYERTPAGSRELPIKVLDMGMGHERNAWFTKGTATSYETTFPTVCKKLFNATGIKIDKELVNRFLPYSSYLNIDEVENVDKAWQSVAAKLGTSAKELKEGILPMAAMFSIAEHSRSLLVAFADGALPSNVGGGYNLRVIMRRSLSFIDKYRWDIDLKAVMEWHADYLRQLFPELRKNLANAHTILDVEQNKYANTKQKTKSLLSSIIKKDIDEKTLLRLYDSDGIPPELVKQEAEALGRKVQIPDDFYASVAVLHDKTVQEHATVRDEKLDLYGVPETKALYYKSWKETDFKASVVKVIGRFVLLDQTLFYPTSGGQLHDIGTLTAVNGKNEKMAAAVGVVGVVDVFKQGSHIVHVLEEKDAGALKAGDAVEGKVDFKRRKQLAQHHTATHIINAAARRVLGPHANQAGAKKTVEKAHIDVTHYESITDDQLHRIEEEANKIVKENIPMSLRFMPRDAAEKKYGMAIYQGGAVPGKDLRIVEIPEVDVECCGGTHLHSTGEAEKIKIIKSSKIQDGVVRITFVAGAAASQEENMEHAVLSETAQLLGCAIHQLPARAEELFEKWKAVVKKKKVLEDMRLTSADTFDGHEKDILAAVCEAWKVQPENVVKTAKRFLEEMEKNR